MAELREGVTYQSGCTLLNASVDTEEIPAPVEQPTHTTLPVCLDRTIVVFDLETTSLSRSSEITQVAALVLGSDVVTSFNQFLMPAGSISSEASKVTGLAVSTQGGTRVLTLHQKVVPSVTQKAGLVKFIDWLGALPSSAVLVGHNSHSFDIPVLLNTLTQHGLLEQFAQGTDGFADSLSIFKSMSAGPDSYALGKLYRHHFGEDFAAHDAVADVAALARLLQKTGADVHAAAVTCASAVECLRFSNNTSSRLDSFSPLISAKVLSKVMAKKAASSGLSLRHVELAFQRSNEVGIAALFKEKSKTNSSRVTSSKKLLQQSTSISPVFPHSVGKIRRPKIR